MYYLGQSSQELTYLLLFTGCMCIKKLFNQKSYHLEPFVQWVISLKFYYTTISDIMANSSSFLESSSFSSPPPLRKVDDKFILGVLGTVDLWETTGTSFEFGITSSSMLPRIEYLNMPEFLSEDVLVVLDRVYHRVVKYRLTQEHPHIG